MFDHLSIPQLEQDWEAFVQPFDAIYTNCYNNKLTEEECIAQMQVLIEQSTAIPWLKWVTLSEMGIHLDYPIASVFEPQFQQYETHVLQSMHLWKVKEYLETIRDLSPTELIKAVWIDGNPTSATDLFEGMVDIPWKPYVWIWTLGMLAKKGVDWALSTTNLWVEFQSDGINSIPDEIQYLTSLREVSLPGLDISALPDGFAQLKELRQLAIDGNDLKGIPSWFAGFSKLEVLDISYNAFDDVPSVLAQMPSLTTLTLGYQTQQSFFDSIHILQSMPNLKDLYLDIGEEELDRKRLHQLLPKCTHL